MQKVITQVKKSESEEDDDDSDLDREAGEEIVKPSIQVEDFESTWD